LVPPILKLFGSNDRAMRVTLLDNLSSYIEYLKPKIVSDKIFPNVVGDPNCSCRFL
jgi:SCY1-like protein 1